MRTAYRLFILATLAVLAYGVATAGISNHPWFLAGPALVLWAVGCIQQLRRDRDSTPAHDSA